jgi:hypothetical protein
MTEQAISPLRRRMIEDMSIRKFAAKTRRYHLQRAQGFRGVPWPITRHGACGGGAPLSASSHGEWRGHAEDQRHRRRPNGHHRDLPTWLRPTLIPPQYQPRSGSTRHDHVYGTAGSLACSPALHPPRRRSPKSPGTLNCTADPASHTTKTTINSIMTHHHARHQHQPTSSSRTTPAGISVKSP